MAEVAIGEALGSGFGLIRRNPGPFLVWWLVYLVFGVGPSIAFIYLLGPDYVAFLRELADTAGRAGPEAAQSFNQAAQSFSAKAQLFNGLSLLGALACYSLLFAAIFRAVLRPDDRGFGYLKLGKDELFQGLIAFILYILFTIALTVAIIIVAIPVGIAAAVAKSVGVAVILGVVGVTGVIVAVSWVFVRLGMALPMTFAEGNFRLFEAWAFTRGHAWRLFGLAVVLMLMIFVLEIVGLAIMGAGGLSLILAKGADLKTYFSQTPEQLIRDLGPILLALSVVMSLGGAAIMVIMIAPWAYAYRQIAGVRHDPAQAFS